MHRKRLIMDRHRGLMKVRLTYYTGAVFRLYPQISRVWIDA